MNPSRGLGASLSRWFFVKVLFAVSPFWFHAIVLFFYGQTITLEKLFSQGGLFIVSVGLSVDAASRLIGSGTEFLDLKFLIAGITTSIGFLSAGMFVIMLEADLIKEALAVTDRWIATNSLIFFIAIFAAGIGCIFLEGV